MSNEVEGVQTKVKVASLTNPIDYSYRYIDYVAISTFVKQWHPETNIFHVPFGKMTITLDDVNQISGVNVEQKLLYDDDGGREIELKVAITLVKRLMGCVKGWLDRNAKNHIR